jgi:amino acid adenylation domain-containing protein
VSGLITHRDQVDYLLADPQPAGRRFPVVSVGAGLPARQGVVRWDDALGGQPLPHEDAPRDPDALAYVLYTSGSQGIPKGVALTHANGLAFADWSVREFGLRPTDRVAGHAPLHFDLSTLDVFATGRAGACLVLVPESQVGMGSVLNRFVVDRRITVWYSVPNALGRMVTARNSALLTRSPLRVVLFAGETFPIPRVRSLRALVPSADLYNLYGPTETNVCTYHRVRDTDVAPGRTAPLPIGRPCPYATAVVIDRDGAPVELAPGATGELCVAGASRMRGYWGDRTLTAAKTVSVAQHGGVPLIAHRTGDLVRLDDDLNLVFLGRADDMVKVRGHRVELGEVEAVLSTADNAREVAAVAVGDDEKHIEAYVVPCTQPCEVTELRRHCVEGLPRYMVPERFHVVAELPRTPTGKIDRRALIAR